MSPSFVIHHSRRGRDRVAPMATEGWERATSCFTTCPLLFSESAQLMKYSEILPSYQRRMRYFPLSASRLPLCKFVRASIFQRLVRENCDGENACDFGSTCTFWTGVRSVGPMKKGERDKTSETFPYGAARARTFLFRF